MVGGLATAIALTRVSDLIATVPDAIRAFCAPECIGVSLPLSTPEFTVSLLWHPRLDVDLAHRWLRGHVRQICATTT